jgi:hypothetical protein
VRIWRLSMAEHVFGFEAARNGVDQVLAVKPTVDGRSHVPPSHTFVLQPYVDDSARAQTFGRVGAHDGPEGSRVKVKEAPVRPRGA